MTRLPPLHALRAFWLVTRAGGIRAAAEEAGVGHAALTQQIQRLEGTLGVRLFDRRSRSLRLTKAAEAYAAEVDRAFQVISAATHTLTRRNASNILHIGASSSIAVRLILPHLDAFRAFYPSITVRMITPATLNELSDGTIDGAFFFEIDDNINIRHESLISEQIIPIASPSLSKEISKMKFRIPEAQWRLLGVDAPSWRNDWERFFRIQYDMAAPAPRITWLSSPLAALQAAVDGLGIALMFPSIMREELSTNRVKALPGFCSTALVRQVNFYTMSEFPETNSMRIYLDWLRPRLTSNAIG